MTTVGHPLNNRPRPVLDRTNFLQTLQKSDQPAVIVTDNNVKDERSMNCKFKLSNVHSIIYTASNSSLSTEVTFQESGLDNHNKLLVIINRT